LSSSDSIEAKLDPAHAVEAAAASMRVLLAWASSALDELHERSQKDSALSRQWLALELRGRLERPRRLLAMALQPCAELGADSRVSLLSVFNFLIISHSATILTSHFIIFIYLL
jgi:hypothetical protein